MTPHPHTISADATMQRAHQIMREQDIRHLPVMHQGVPVGVLSLRDLHLLETLKDVDPAEVPVEDAMTAEPVLVAPDASLQEVASVMAQGRIGSVLITENKKLVGIFTTTDALVALAQLARTS